MKIIVVKVVVTSDEVDEENKSFKFLGTAFFVDKQTVITATHVIENHFISDDERLYLIGVPNGGEIAVDKTLIIKCENTDISILKLKFPINEIENVAFSSSSLEMQKKVEIEGYGSSSGGKEKLTYTISGQYNEYYAVKLQGSTKGGFSGSPVVIDGKVYGVAHASDAFSTYIIPISEICDNSILNPVDDKGNVVKNPYKGLNSFTYKDQHNFYGREKESQEIAESLKKCRLYTLLGASGSGKSSLIFAGVKPLIENDETIMIDFRLNDEPFKDLVDELVVKADTDSFLKNPKERIEELKKEEYDLDTLMKRFLEHVKGKEKIYLIIDQFEELFTSEKDKVDIKVFFNQLLTLINSNLEITVVIVMRTDFLVKFSNFESFNNAYNEQSKLNLTQLGREQLRKVIVEPAKGLGVTFQDGLVNQIIEEIENKAGQLPVLEFALEQLWNDKVGKVITHEVLDNMGGVTHAISNHAEKIYNDESEKQESIKKVFMKLVNPARQLGDATNAYDTRRIASFDEFDEKEIETIRELATNRLVVTRELTNEKDDEKKIVVDIIHEALIREWDRLKDWIVEHRDFLIWQEQLEKDRVFYLESGAKKEDLLVESKLLKATQLLESHGGYISPLDRNFIEKSLDEDKSKKRKKKYKLVGFFIFLLIVIIALLFSWGTTGQSMQKAKEALNLAKKAFNKSLTSQGVLYRELNQLLEYKHLFAKAIDNDINSSLSRKIMYLNTSSVIGELKDYRFISFDNYNDLYQQFNYPDLSNYDLSFDPKFYDDNGYKVSLFTRISSDSKESIKIRKFKNNIIESSYTLYYNDEYFIGTYPLKPIIIPELEVIILAGLYEHDTTTEIIIDKMEKNGFNKYEKVVYESKHRLQNIFLTKNKKYFISYTKNQINITRILNNKAYMTEINAYVNGVVYLKDNIFAYWFGNKIEIIEISDGGYRTIATLYNFIKVSLVFIDDDYNLVVLGNSNHNVNPNDYNWVEDENRTLSKWDISKVFNSNKNIKYEKKDGISTIFDESQEDNNFNEESSYTINNIDINISEDTVRISGNNLNYTLKHNLLQDEMERMYVGEGTSAQLSEDLNFLLSFSCYAHVNAVAVGDPCTCKLYLTDIITKTHLIKIQDMCITKTGFLERSNGIYVEYNEETSFYRTDNLKNIKDGLYSLKTIVDTATEYTNGELKILTPDEWKDKKDEYEKKLKESKNK